MPKETTESFEKGAFEKAWDTSRHFVFMGFVGIPASFDLQENSRH